MIRAAFRLLGLLLIATAFLFAVYDGARSIADQAIRLTRLGDFWNDLHQTSLAALRTDIESVAPAAWSAMRLLLEQPVWALMGGLGLLLMLAFRPKKALIGYARR